AGEVEKLKKQIEELNKQKDDAEKVKSFMPKVESALQSNNVQIVQATLDNAKELAKTATLAKNDVLKGAIASLEKHLDELKAMPGLLEKVAKNAKPIVVAIRTMAYAIPKGQTETTTGIRELVGYAEASGFLAAKDKIVTTKEAVEPWRFDAKTC